MLQQEFIPNPETTLNPENAIFTGPIAGQLRTDPAELGFHPFDDEILQTDCKSNGKNKHQGTGTHSTYKFKNDSRQTTLVSVDERAIPCRAAASSTNQVLDLFVEVLEVSGYPFCGDGENFSMKLWSSNGKSDSDVAFSSLQDFIPKTGNAFIYDYTTPQFNNGSEGASKVSAYHLKFQFDYVEPTTVYATELSYEGCTEDSNFQSLLSSRKWRTKDNFGRFENDNDEESMTTILRNNQIHAFKFFVDDEVFDKPFNEKLAMNIDARYDFWFESTSLQNSWSADAANQYAELRSMCTNTSTSDTLQVVIYSESLKNVSAKCLQQLDCIGLLTPSQTEKVGLINVKKSNASLGFLDTDLDFYIQQFLNGHINFTLGSDIDLDQFSNLYLKRVAEKNQSADFNMEVIVQPVRITTNMGIPKNLTMVPDATVCYRECFAINCFAISLSEQNGTFSCLLYEINQNTEMALDTVSSIPDDYHSVIIMSDVLYSDICVEVDLQLSTLTPSFNPLRIVWKNQEEIPMINQPVIEVGETSDEDCRSFCILSGLCSSFSNDDSCTLVSLTKPDLTNIVSTQLFGKPSQVLNGGIRTFSQNLTVTNPLQSIISELFDSNGKRLCGEGFSQNATTVPIYGFVKKKRSKFFGSCDTKLWKIRQKTNEGKLEKKFFFLAFLAIQL